MNTVLAGFVTYGASEPLGLPEEYGLYCVVVGMLTLAAAFRLLPRQNKPN